MNTTNSAAKIENLRLAAMAAYAAYDAALASQALGIGESLSDEVEALYAAAAAAYRALASARSEVA
jgi:hypothetical protein